MHESPDRYGTLKLFVRVAELRSFSEVARETSLAQSTVSRRIRLLEEQLGAQLLRRTTRVVSLTAEGERYLARVRDALRTLDAADDEVRGASAAIVGTLRITAPTGFGHRHVAPIVDAFLARHPHANVELTLSDDYATLIDDGYDLAIRLGSLEDSSLRRVKLGTFHRLVVASPELVARTERIRAPEQLSRVECLSYTSLASPRCWVLRSGRFERTIGIHGRFGSNHLLCLHEAALRGRGFAALPSWLVRDSLQRAELVRVLPKWTAGTVPINAVMPPGGHVPMRVRRFLQSLGQAPELRGDAED